MKIPQAYPLSEKSIRSIVRPIDVDFKKYRVDAYVRKIRGEQEPGDEVAIDSISGLSLT